MFLDSAAAKALAAIIVLNVYGPDTLNPQLPLSVEDREPFWLVKGTPYTDAQEQMAFVQFHMFIRKDNADIVGYGTDGRQMLDDKQTAYWHTIMTPEEFKRVFGPATRFEPWAGVNDLERVMFLRFNGGFLIKPEAALDYAFVLLQASFSPARGLTRDNLATNLKDDIWHIRTIKAQAGFPPQTEILTLSRQTGRLMSGII